MPLNSFCDPGVGQLHRGWTSEPFSSSRPRFSPPGRAALLDQDGQIAVGIGNEPFLAGVAATAVAWVSENILVTIVAGMLDF